MVNTDGLTPYSFGVQHVSHPDDEWKAIPGFDDYEVSNKGHVRSTKGRMRTITYDARGYGTVGIKKKTMTIHRLVAMAFLGMPADSTMVVDHIDGNKSNNNVENLRVISHSDNIKNAYENGFATGREKQCVIQVTYDGTIAQTFESLTRAETVTGFNRGSIHNALTNGATSHGYRWFGSMEEYEEARCSGSLYKDFFKVFQVDKEKRLVQTFDSYPQAAKSVDGSVSAISRACKKGYIVNGYRWYQCYEDYRLDCL